MRKICTVPRLDSEPQVRIPISQGWYPNGHSTNAKALVSLCPIYPCLLYTSYFRDVKNQDVLLFIDNIFRVTQAGSEVSALLGRMPSAVGYQPTLATEMGALQERITSTRKGSITSVPVSYTHL